MLIKNPLTNKFEPTQKEIDKLKQTLSPDEWYKFIKDKTDDLDVLKAAKKEHLDVACNQSIFEGFFSNALGGTNFYKFDIETQLNLVGVKDMFDAGIIESYPWNTKNDGVKIHTKEQFYKVYYDSVEHKKNMTTRYWKLKEEVFACTDKKQIDLINW